MRTFKSVWVLVLLSVFVLAGFSFAADVAKIGIIDVQRVLATSTAGKAAQAQIKKQKAKMESDLKKKGAEIEALRKRLDRESMVMSKQMREEKEREGRIKLNDFKALQQKYRTDLQVLEKKLVGQIQQDVVELVTEMGRKEGYLLIMGKLGVLYAPSSVDITDKVIQQLNVRFAKKTGQKK